MDKDESEKSISSKDWDRVNWHKLDPHHGHFRVSQVLDLIPPEGIHLDVGTGRGDGTILISKKKKCIGFDYGVVSAKIAKEKGLEIFQADARKMPFKSGTFNSITCLDVIEHIPNPDIAIREISRVLKKDGKLILMTPTEEMIKEKLLHFVRKHNIKQQKQPYDIPLKNSDLLRLLKENNFEILSEKKVKNWDPNTLLRAISFTKLFYCIKK
jgi:ubiquinone/menaquinone biosynthesis C-methylase UbiE